MSNDTTFEPKDILSKCLLVNPQDTQYLKLELIQEFGSPNQPIFTETVTLTVNGIHYINPCILPIYNGQLELIQCAVLQNKQRVSVLPDGLAKGFTFYGDMQKDKPVIVTYSLEAFFKIAQTNYSVILVMLPNLCSPSDRKPDGYDFKQIQFVIEQLTKAGFSQLYLPVRPEHIKSEDFQALEQNTSVYLLNQYLSKDDNEFLIKLYKDEEEKEVSVFLEEAIRQHLKNDVLPKGHTAKPFMLDDNSYLHSLETGLVLIQEKQLPNGENKQIKTLISPPIQVLGEARSVNNIHWKRVIQFKDKDGQQHRLLIPYEHFMGEAQEALKHIANHGLMSPRKAFKKNIFIQYIQDYPIDNRFRCVDSTGWHGDNFITPIKTYGNSEAEELLFHYEGKNPYETKGTLQEWQELSLLIEPHALAVLSFSCAFAGQLVAPLGVESGGFHIYGSSTDGKSTITKAACSIWGNPKDISKSWRTTDNALENEAELRNDNFLNLDELRQAAPKAVSDIVYMLTGGQGKARSSKAGKNRDLKQFNIMYSSTGEVTFEEHLRRGNIELDAGLLLRFAHLPSDAGKGYGVFEEINFGESPQDIGNRINALSIQNYGLAGMRWLEYLTIDKQSVIKQAVILFNEFIASYQHIKNGQAQRVLRRFALVATAGELATCAGITEWKKNRAFNALKQCFQIWLSNGLGNDTNLEERKVLEHIKSFFEANGSSRFEDLTILRHMDGEIIRPRINNRVGYYHPDIKMYLVSPTMFKKEMCLGMNEANIKKVLIKRGWLITVNEGGKILSSKKMSCNLPDGTRPRMMHFSIEAIQSDDEF